VLALAMLMATTVTAQAPSARVANSAQPQITFAKDVVPILQAKCQDCHHTGGMAPMSLVTYEEARPWAKAMKQRVETRVMPPWHLDKTVGIQRFQNDLSLSDEQIATIVRWVDEGAPLGNPKDLPAPKQWPSEDGWQLAKQFGAPDLVIDTGSYTMPAHGRVVEAALRGAHHGAALGPRRRDQTGDPGGPQDHASRARPSAARRTGFAEDALQRYRCR